MKTPNGLELPIVNLNGTSKLELEKQYREAVLSCDELLDALAGMNPHGRDYQIGDSDYTVARKQHIQRTALVAKVRDELIEIYHSFEAQLMDRKR